MQEHESGLTGSWLIILDPQRGSRAKQGVRPGYKIPKLLQWSAFSNIAVLPNGSTTFPHIATSWEPSELMGDTSLKSHHQVGSLY